MIAGLELALVVGADSLSIRSDSQLVVRQVNVEFESRCGPYPIHGPARLAFKWKEKCEKKMWVDFRVLENPCPRRNGFTLESPLTFIFIFKWGKPSKKKKP